MRLKHGFAVGLAILTMAATGLLPSPAAADVLVSSDFSVDDEGWLLSGDATSAVPTYVSPGGNPGGFIRGVDITVGGVWFWEAPAKFLGNVSAAYGFSLTFDSRMRGSGPLFDDSDIILVGGGLSLHLAAISPVPQDVSWTSYSALLSETAGWRVNSLGGLAATQTQMQTVLSNLTRLRIRGEFITGPDNGDLDNVVLNGVVPSAVPEPGSLTLGGLGLATLLGFTRLRGKRARR